MDRYLSSLDVWAMAFGCMVGWGAFVMPGTSFLPVAGPAGTILAMVIGLAVMLVIASSVSFLMNRSPAHGRRLFLYQRGLRAGSRVSLLLVPLPFLPDHRFSQRDGAVPGDPNADGRRFQRSGTLHGQRKPGLSIGRYSYPYSLWRVLACCSSWQSRFCSGCIRSSP